MERRILEYQFNLYWKNFGPTIHRDGQAAYVSYAELPCKPPYFQYLEGGIRVGTRKAARATIGLGNRIPFFDRGVNSTSNPVEQARTYCWLSGISPLP